MSRPNELYLVVVSDGASEMYQYGVPEEKDQPQVLYTSVTDVKRAIEKFAAKFDTFIPVAYGQAYPYESTSFDQELQKGYAVYGWGTVKGEDEDDVANVAITVMRLRVA